MDTLFDGIQQSGMNHEIVWNASNVASSVYFVKMVAGDYTAKQTITLQK